jgi:SPP1 family predicted phage head-tail adaptor
VLTAAEITAMRIVEESVLSSTATIQRHALTRDGMGGYSEAWTTVGTVVCDFWHISQRGDRERVTGNQLTQVADWFVTVPYDTDITAKDRMVIEGRTFEVVFVPNDISWKTALRVEVKSLNEELRV